MCWISFFFYTFTWSGSTASERRAEHNISVMIYVRKGWFCFSSLYLSFSLSCYMFMLTFLFLVGPFVVHRRQRNKSKLCFWRHAKCLVQCSVYFPGYIVFYHNAVAVNSESDCECKCFRTLHSWQTLKALYSQLLKCFAMPQCF